MSNVTESGAGYGDEKSRGNVMVEVSEKLMWRVVICSCEMV